MALVPGSGTASPSRPPQVRLPMSLLQESDRLELHADLYDTHIDICTPELLLLLQDNFDWQVRL